MSRTIDIDTKTFVRVWLVLIAFAAAGFFSIKAAGGLIIVGISAFLAIRISSFYHCTSFCHYRGSNWSGYCRASF